MRHYIRYNSIGVLVGCDTRTHGWPVGADPRDPNTEDSAAIWIQKRRSNSKAPYAGWAAYDCPCTRSVGSCHCASKMLPDHYFNGTVLFPKPALTVEVDGFPVVGGRLTATSDSQVVLVLRAAVPEGCEVVVADTRGNLSSVLAEPATLVFSNGTTAPLHLTVPSQGISSSIKGINKYVRSFVLTLQGWA